MNNEALAGATAVSFVLTNSTISANDVSIVNVGSNTTGSAAGAYTTYVSYLAAGSCLITLRNLTAATSYAEAVSINFAIIHGASEKWSSISATRFTARKWRALKRKLFTTKRTAG